MIAKLSWKSDDEFVEVESPEKALSIIRQVDDESREQPISLDIARSDGEVMMIILGAARSCLAWFPGNYNGLGSLHTVSEGFEPGVDHVPPNPEVITYYYFGHHSESPMEYTISKEKAFQAVESFLSAPGPPDCVRWEKD
jgi:hypothetical protein